MRGKVLRRRIGAGQVVHAVKGFQFRRLNVKHLFVVRCLEFIVAFFDARKYKHAFAPSPLGCVLGQFVVHDNQGAVAVQALRGHLCVHLRGVVILEGNADGATVLARYGNTQLAPVVAGVDEAVQVALSPLTQGRELKFVFV